MLKQPLFDIGLILQQNVAGIIIERGIGDERGIGEKARGFDLQPVIFGFGQVDFESRHDGPPRIFAGVYEKG